MLRRATAGRGRGHVSLLLGVGLVFASPSPFAAASTPERGRFACPTGGRGHVPENAAAAALSAALGRPAGLIDEIVRTDTPVVPGYAGIVVGVLRDAEGGEAAIVPMLRCDDSVCAGEPIRFRGAEHIRVRAVLDLAGYDGDVLVGEAGDLRGPSLRGPTPRGCARRPALIVEVVDGPEHGSDRLVMIVTMLSAGLRVIHSERSHVGLEGASTVVALRFRGTRGGSPSDLVVLRQRQSAQTGGIAVVREHLFNYVDGRYRSAP